jgi:hypothetical protein
MRDKGWAYWIYTQAAIGFSPPSLEDYESGFRYTRSFQFLKNEAKYISDCHSLHMPSLHEAVSVLTRAISIFLIPVGVSWPECRQKSGHKNGKQINWNVSQFKYSGTTVTNQNLSQKKIRRRLISGNSCCHSVQNLLSSRLLLKIIKIKIYKTTILSAVLYGCET